MGDGNSDTSGDIFPDSLFYLYGEVEFALTVRIYKLAICYVRIKLHTVVFMYKMVINSLRADSCTCGINNLYIYTNNYGE